MYIYIYIYRMFSQFDGSKNSFLLDGIFSAFIDIEFNKGY